MVEVHNLPKQLLESLQSTKNQLEREKLLIQLEYTLPQLQEEQVKQLFYFNSKQLEETDGNLWFPIFCLLLVQEKVLSFIANHETQQLEWKKDISFQEECFRFSKTCVSLVEASENRVQSLARKQLELLVYIFGTQFFDLVYPPIAEIGKKALLDEGTKTTHAVEDHLQGRLYAVSESRNVSCLETSLETIAGILKSEGVARLNNNIFAKELLSFLNKCYKHSNRFVRESCQRVIFSLVETTKVQWNDVEPSLVDNIANIIASGMEDNWSQVRFAASTSCRMFLEKSKKQEYDSLLLPRLRLNCHYAAEGVKSYNLESWKLVLKGNGLQKFTELTDAFLDYYISQTVADNHSVREAACYAMEEAVEKLPFQALQGHIKQILQALLVCFQDESWPVRDCACLVCGSVISKYPKQVQEDIDMEKLVELWKDALTDNIPSVRENSATALWKACQAVDNHISLSYDTLLEYCSQLLLRVADQPKNPERYGTAKDTQFGAAHKLAHDNDKEIHLEQQMYSCGSLAPKLKGGHSCDRKYRRVKEPWEESDGALRLWKHLLRNNPRKACKLLPVSMQIFQHLQFGKAPYLLDTFWSTIIDTVDYLDKESLKPYSSLLLEQVENAKRSEYASLAKNAQIASRKLQRILV